MMAMSRPLFPSTAQRRQSASRGAIWTSPSDVARGACNKRPRPNFPLGKRRTRMSWLPDDRIAKGNLGHSTAASIRPACAERGCRTRPRTAVCVATG